MNELIELKYLDKPVQLPKGWRLVKLGDFYKDLSSGSTPTRKRPDFFHGNIPWITSGELNYNHVTTTYEQITEEAVKQTNLKLHPVGTFFIAITGLEAAGTRGSCAINAVPATTNQSCMAFPKIKEIDTSFLFQFYCCFGDKLAFAYAQGTKQQSFNSTIVKAFPLLLPPIEEQVKIGEVLNSYDLIIQKIEKLIELKKNQRKAISQKLLSGKVRFKEFKKLKWKSVNLAQYLVKHEEKTTENNQYPVLTSSRNGIMLQREYYSGREVASKNNVGYNVVPYGYFTYRHMSDDIIFKFNINTIVEKGIVSTLYPVFNCKNIDKDFLCLKLNEGQEFKNFALEQKQGGSRTYMYFSKLLELNINAPALPEQRKISKTLLSFDEEMQLQKKQLLLFKSQKKGLMMKLLTGEIRIK